VSWAFLPDAPTYAVPVYPGTLSALVFAMAAGPLIGGIAVLFVRAVAWADRHKPRGPWRLLAPVLALALVGAVSAEFPQVLGNGKDVAQLAFGGRIRAPLLLALVVLKPAATLLCLGSGAPGGLFTPSLSFGAMLGGALGLGFSWLWPGVPPGLCALLGAGALVAATTQGPVSTVVLIMELTGHARSFVLPLLLIVAAATLTARTIDPRSIYDARLNDDEISQRRQQRQGGTLAAGDG
jgi:chloride channel protein, CIC family